MNDAPRTSAFITTTTSAMGSDPSPVWHQPSDWERVGPAVIAFSPPLDAMSRLPTRSQSDGWLAMAAGRSGYKIITL